MANRYWVGTSGTPWDASTTTGWSATSGGSGGASAPTSADDVFFDANSGSGSVTITAGTCNSLDCTGFVGTWQSTSPVSIGTLAVYGNFTLSSGMTNNFWGSITFAATASKNITTNGITVKSAITFNGVGGSWVLQDNLTQNPPYGTKVITLTNGTFNANNNNVTLPRFNANNANVRTLALGSGTWTVTDTDSGSNYSWDCGTSASNLTVTGTATISLTGSGTSSFYGGGKTWPILNCGSTVVNIRGSNTFTTITNSVVGNIYFEAFATQIVTNFNVNGTSTASRVYLSGVSGNPAALSKTGGQVSVSFCNIVNVYTTGTANWFAYDVNGNIFSGFTTGWVRSGSGLLALLT